MAPPHEPQKQLPVPQPVPQHQPPPPQVAAHSQQQPQPPHPIYPPTPCGHLLNNITTNNTNNIVNAPSIGSCSNASDAPPSSSTGTAESPDSSVNSARDPLVDDPTHPGGVGGNGSTGGSAPVSPRVRCAPDFQTLFQHFKAQKPGSQNGKKPRAETSTAQRRPAEDCSQVVIGGRYLLLKTMGSGSFGIVYDAIDCSSSDPTHMKHVAVKQVQRPFKHLSRTKNALREIALLRSLRHPNVMSLMDLYLDNTNDSIFFVTELMDMDLHKFLKVVRPSAALVRFIAFGILCGVQYLHHNSVVHRDLKPGNILLRYHADTLDIKIGDFGLARELPHEDQPLRPMSIEVITIWYRPPELCLPSPCTSYGPGVDMWSVGCVLAELFLGTPLFMGKTTHDQLMKITSMVAVPVQGLETITEDRTTQQFLLRLPRPHQSLHRTMRTYGKSASELVENLLQFLPTKRMTAGQALCTAYFRHYAYKDMSANCVTAMVSMDPDEGLSHEQLKRNLIHNVLSYQSEDSPGSCTSSPQQIAAAVRNMALG